MWWKCDVQFFRTILRLKIWARSEPEARTKVERMYQVGTIQDLAPVDTSTITACAEPELESAVDRFRRFQLPRA